MPRAIAAHPRGRWPAEAAIDTVTLAYLDRHRRRIRLVADSGETFLLDLPRAQHLGDGDGLELEGGGYIRVAAKPEPVLEIEAANAAALLRLAWHLGNRHLPAEIDEGRILIRHDHVILRMLEGLGAMTRVVQAPFNPEGGAYGEHNRAPTNPHGHHDHQHDHEHDHHHHDHGDDCCHDHHH